MTAPIEDRFARENEFYAEFWSTGGWGQPEPNEDERRRADTICELIALCRTEKSDRRILDLGCGRGWLTNLLQKYGSATGIDPVPAAVERAKTLFPDLDFHVADAPHALARFGPETFDLVVSSEVIEHIPDEEKVEFLRTIRQLLKPGGALILTTPRGEAWRGWQYWHPDDQPVEQWIREADLPALCRSAGFTVQAHRRVFVTGTWHSWLSRVVTAKRFAPLMNRFPNAPILRALRYRCSIYQVALCLRDEQSS